MGIVRVAEDVESAVVAAAAGGGGGEVTAPLLLRQHKQRRGEEEEEEKIQDDAGGDGGGRRGGGGGSMWMLMLSTAVAVCGSFEFGTCGVNMLYFGRILLGFSTGILSYVLLICSGSSATYIIGALVAWRNLVLVGIVPCVLLLTGLLFIPESPRWLANVGREKEFHASLQMLRGEDADVSEEAVEIKEYIESLHRFPNARVQDLFLSKNIYAVIVGVGLMIFQQLGGINGVGFYASSIFTSAGFSGKLGTILIGIIQIPITLFGAILMDKSGRRVLLMVSASGTFLGCFLTGISFYLKAQGLFSEWVPELALTGILVYIGAYSIGMGPVPWVVMSEIFSIDMKAIGGSLVTLVSWLGSFAISYSFSFLMDWSSAGTFFMFSAASLITILFVVTLVPETKGRTLEEIQDSLINSRSRLRDP
uniref:Major facilitator superfamily (MFS) profile domain-containing protein n=1 Tax=Oryza punctata TaxID=4537 RepID=A0A0E0KE07_ORYPU